MSAGNITLRLAREDGRQRPDDEARPDELSPAAADVAGAIRPPQAAREEQELPLLVSPRLGAGRDEMAQPAWPSGSGLCIDVDPDAISGPWSSTERHADHTRFQSF